MTHFAFSKMRVFKRLRRAASALASMRVQVALLFCIALALRLYAIDRQSLWGDEGSSIALASRSIAQIARDTANDAHPPLFFWLLHFWMRLFGTSVFALRSLSVVCGALTVSITYLLGRRWFGQPAAVVAAVAGLLAPLAIHYAQETRMYALVMLLSALVWLTLDDWLARPSWRRLGIFGLSALAALLSHYFAAAILVATNLIWLIALIANVQRRRMAGMRGWAMIEWQHVLGWCGVQLLLIAVYLPLVARNRTTLTNWSTIPRGEFGPSYIIGDTLQVFSRGMSVDPGGQAWLIGFAGLLAAGLLARSQRRPGIDGRFLAAAWLFVPLGLMLALAFNQPLYQPRFLLLALPGFHLLIGHGAAALGRRLRAARLALPAATLFFALAARESLMNEWFNPRFWRDDYRGIAREIAASAGPHDAIMVMGLSPLETLDYYYAGTQARFVIPRWRPLDRAATEGDLAGIAQRYRRVYVLSYVPYEADPDQVIASWLDAHAFKSSNHWYGGVELLSYEFGDLPSLRRPLDVHFGSQIWLQRGVTAPTSVAPSDAIRILLEWSAVARLDRPLSLFAHLVADDGEIVAQYDRPLVSHTSEQQQALPRQIRLAILVPPGVRPGSYHVLIGIYDSETGERLRLANGDTILKFVTVTVEAG
jgi:4-amino-4-deoxy-L-arabinose transferase-like glycosyltransferase